MVSTVLRGGPPVTGQEVSEGPRQQSSCPRTGRLARPGGNRAGTEAPHPGMSSQPPGVRPVKGGAVYDQARS